MRCRKFESRFEDYLGGAADSELHDHLTVCQDCRAALEDSRLAGSLLREAWEPASEPSQAFLANVMARIHREEERAKSPAAFWAPGIPRFPTVLDGSRGLARSLGLSGGIWSEPNRDIGLDSHRTERQRFSAASRGSGKQRRSAAISG